ncbi:MAG: serine hydrolase domain-containing protein [Sphingopyxis sp.]|uniref:serine hydrolase domain-containing protein n=1 Tax=Sphingopyxis sp. TaxID=1908224 RepID=UPI002AB87960|nr:serine hydrolase domain-containing protein [Sphingopyxis sp.]MDZ3833110.1 serine hydrolase domain-containing protein [Sphingopyxis sp.]
MTTPLDLTRSTAKGAAARLDRVVQDFVDVLGNLGVVVSLSLPGSDMISFTAGFADREKASPVSAEHRFQIGSQTKTFVAVTMFLLDRADVLDLDRPVTEYVDLPIDPRITSRHLIMNMSGLGEFTKAFPVGLLDPRIGYSSRDLVALALPQGQLFSPGEHFDYCNTGWIIAGLIIEKLCERPFGEVIGDMICAPLGLSETSFTSDYSTEDMLKGYIVTPVSPDPIDVSGYLDWANAAGNGISTMRDIVAFYRSFNAPQSPIGVSLADLTRQLGRPSADPHFALSVGTEYGLGIERRAWAGREVWGHPGSTLAYLTSTWIDSELDIAVATCVTREMSPVAGTSDLRYPRDQLFAMALATAYALADR